MRALAVQQKGAASYRLEEGSDQAFVLRDPFAELRLAGAQLDAQYCSWLRPPLRDIATHKMSTDGRRPDYNYWCRMRPGRTHLAIQPNLPDGTTIGVVVD